MKPLGAGQGKSNALPALVITSILYIIGIWAGLSASWIQQYVLQNLFTIVTVMVILAGSIAVCLIPERGLVSKLVLGFAAGLFQGLLTAWIQRDGLIPLFLGVSVVIILFLGSLRYAHNIPRPAITLQGIPRIILAGLLSNLLFVGLTLITVFSMLDLTPQDRFWVFFVGFPLAGFIMGIAASMLAGQGYGGVVATIITGIGWFIFGEAALIPLLHGTSRDLFLDHIFLFYAVIIMPLLGAFVMRARGRSPGHTVGWAIALFVSSLLIFLCVAIPLAPIVLLILQYLPQMFSPNAPH